MVDTIVDRVRDLFLIGTIFIASCTISHGQSLDTLIGTWIGCNSKGEYVEIHFSKYESLFVNNDVIDVTYAVPYSILGNEIHYTNVRLQKTFISFFDRKEENLTLKDDFGTYELKRISDFPVVPPSSLNLGSKHDVSDSILVVHYERMFTLREAEYECEGN